MLRQSERHDRVPDGRTIEAPVPRGRDHDVLTPPLARAVGHRGGLASERQPRPPQLFTGLEIEGAQIPIEGCADEDEPARGDEWPADVREAHADRNRHWKGVAQGAEGNLPDDLAANEIDRSQ